IAAQLQLPCEFLPEHPDTGAEVADVGVPGVRPRPRRCLLRALHRRTYGLGYAPGVVPDRPGQLLRERRTGQLCGPPYLVDQRLAELVHQHGRPGRPTGRLVPPQPGRVSLRLPELLDHLLRPPRNPGDVQPGSYYEVVSRHPRSVPLSAAIPPAASSRGRSRVPPVSAPSPRGRGRRCRRAPYARGPAPSSPPDVGSSSSTTV